MRSFSTIFEDKISSLSHTTGMKKTRKIIFILFLILSSVLYITGWVVFLKLSDGATLDVSKLPINAENISVYDKNGDEISKNHRILKLEEMSHYIPEAFLSMEDKRFYRHNGIDVIRIGGALIEDIKSRDFTQGGSTITCQLIKNTQLTSEKSLKRKFQEAKLAMKLERKYDKKEILEMYFDVLYFGKNIYGVEGACRNIYGKSPMEINAAEAASLAATIANPSKYSPIYDLSANKARATVVLEQMKKDGYLTEEAAENMKNADIIIKYKEFDNNCTKKAVNFVLNEAKSILESRGILSPKYDVYTYIDPRIQSYAEHALEESSLPSDKIEKKFLLADNKTGGIVAYAGKNSPFTDARQQGSTIKPFLYGAAIEKGILTTETQYNDLPRSYNGYSPKNYKDIYYGWISAETALAKSVNSVAVRILSDTGIENACKYIANCGIDLDEKDKNLALALGGTTFGSTPVELLTAYMTLANQGLQREITFIDKITDKSGRVLYKNAKTAAQTVSASSAFIVTEMMKSAVNSGTAAHLSDLNIPIAAKTGTVALRDGNSDAWIVGFTSEHTFLAWCGSENGQEMPSSVTGGNQPAKMARTLLASLYKNQAPDDFTKPINVRYIKINTDIKENFHLLVPRSAFEIGRSESVPVSDNFTFDHLDQEDFYLEDLEISSERKELSVSFKRVLGIRYEVYADHKKCKEKDFVYQTKCKGNSFVTVEIYCKKGNQTLFRKSKLVIPY